MLTLCALSTVKSADTSGQSTNDPESDPEDWPFVNDAEKNVKAIMENLKKNMN